MKSNIKTKIYNAQCIGNVEPIEFMTPYPSMRSLIEGQTIKFSDQLINKKHRMTNQNFYTYVMQTSNWLESIGVKPKQRIIFPKLEYPDSQILLFSLWNVGCSIILNPNENDKIIKDKVAGAQVIKIDDNFFKIIKQLSNNFIPKHKPLLSDEAILSFEKESGIRLSHYNLLVNVSGIQKAIELKSRSRFYCSLKKGTISWVIFQAILPIYCGCVYDKENPDVIIGDLRGDYILRYDLKNIKEFSKNDIAVCIENTGALSINGKPIHLSNYDILSDGININGHSVMMGYFESNMNEVAFSKNSLKVNF